MANQDSASCDRPTGSVESGPPPATTEPTAKEEVSVMAARVGQKAPGFTAPAYHKGGFTNVSLSDYAGKWVMLCFYPGDFTFV